MKLPIKQLKQNNKIFVPQTTAEAVLVKHDDQVLNLKSVLDKKLEQVITPAGSGLTYKINGPGVILTHSNSIEPIEETKPVQIKFDNRGHIVETKPIGKLTILVNNTKHIEADGTSDQVLSMGDDFTVDNSNIKLKWTEINGNS